MPVVLDILGSKEPISIQKLFTPVPLRELPGIYDGHNSAEFDELTKIRNGVYINLAKAVTEEAAEFHKQIVRQTTPGQPTIRKEFGKRRWLRLRDKAENRIRDLVGYPLLDSAGDFNPNPA